VEAEGEQDRLEVSSFLDSVQPCMEGEPDRLEVSSFLDSVQPCMEGWWRQKESKAGWR
jgi:hypothetical protein